VYVTGIQINIVREKNYFIAKQTASVDPRSPQSMTEDTFETLVRKLELLRVEEDHIIERIRAIATADAGVLPNPPRQGPATGDTIRVLNRRGIPASDLIATVTKVTPDRVHFITRGGIKSWRAAKNVTVVGKTPPQHVNHREHG